MKKLTLLLVACLLPLSLLAATPTCHNHSGGSYCKYFGPVSKIYVNESNLILIYFDSAISVSDANAYGMSINKGVAAAYSIQDNPDFANYLYSTVLAAQASGRSISIQMRGGNPAISALIESGWLSLN